MSLRERISKVFAKENEQEAIGTGNHNNHYKFTEEDFRKSAEQRAINNEITKRKKLRTAYIDKLLDDKEIAIIKKDIAGVSSEDEEGGIDRLMMDTVTSLLIGNGVNLGAVSPTGQTSNVTEDFYSDDILRNANAPLPEVGAEDEGEVSRFTDDEIEKNIPKLLNDTQMKYISEVTPAELLQIQDVIKNKKIINK